MIDLADELKAYLIARDPSAAFEPHPKVKGASNKIREFDYRHGADLISVIPANPNATGGAMRKAGDVQNGPFAEIATPLIIIDDRVEPDRALIEIGNLASVTRAFQSPTSCESCARSSHFIRIPLAESALGKSEADTGSENPKNVWQNW